MPEEKAKNELVLASSSRWLERHGILSQESLNELLGSRTALANRQEPADWSQFELSAPSRAVFNRLRRLVNDEMQSETSEYSEPSFPLLIRQRCASGTAFEAAKQLAALDLAFRRAEALSRQLLETPRALSWPLPTRPERCGLLVVDSSAGSLETIMTVYGALVPVAQSGPVSLVAMASLIWDATRTARRIGHGWVARIHREDSHVEELDWHQRTMKAAMPVMLEAITAGQGVSLTMTSHHGDEVELIVTDRRGGVSGNRGLPGSS